MIIDESGELIWFKAVSANDTVAVRAFNVRVQRYRGEPVLCWFHGSALYGHGEGHYELYDRSYREVARVAAGNGYQGDLHEFLLTDSGTALFTCYGKATGTILVDGVSRRIAYWYGVVQEVDVASGKVLFQWRSDEHIGLEASYRPPTTDPSETWDYFHVNSIAIDPSDGHLIISARNTWAVYKVHRRTGQVLWTLGGRHSSFQMGLGTRFAFQHHAVLHPGGVMTIFDNELGPPAEARASRGLVLGVDQRARRARLLRQYVHDPPVLCEALGSVQTLPNGHVFVGWGPARYFTEYTHDGSVAFEARMAPGAKSYRALKQSWTGVPAGPPDFAVARSGAGAHVFVSWNGATGVAQWRVLGGDQRTALVPLGVAAKHGFETEIEVGDAPLWLSVEALDASGRVLGAAHPQSSP